MATPDYRKLAKEAGAVSSQPGSVDYRALAKQAGAVPSTGGTSVTSRVLDDDGNDISAQPSTNGVVRDVVEGFGSGVAKTGVGLYDLARSLTPNFLPGVKQLPEVSPVIREATQAPNSIAGKIGQGVEQGLEFLIPATKVNQAAKALQTGSKVVNLGTRAALEGTAAAGVAAVQSGGDPTAMRNAALTAGGLTAVGGAVAAGAKPAAKFLREKAVQQYQRVLNPTKEKTKFLARDEVAEGLLDRGVVSRSIEGLESKAADRVAQLGKQIGDAWDNVPAGTRVEADAIVQTLKDAITPHTVVNSAGQRVPIAGGEAQKAISQIEDLQAMLLDVAETNATTGKLEIPVDTIRKLRQYWDGYAAKAGRYHGKTLDEASKAEVQGIASDSIRAELAKDFPDIAAINKEFHFWKNAHLVVKETAQRRVGQTKGLIRKLARVGGTLGGFAQGGMEGAIVGGVAMDQLEKMITSTAWNTVSAVTKDKLAKALAAGHRGEAEFWIAKAFGTSAASTHRPESRTPAVSPAR